VRRRGGGERVPGSEKQNVHTIKANTLGLIDRKEGLGEHNRMIRRGRSSNLGSSCTPNSNKPSTSNGIIKMTHWE